MKKLNYLIVGLISISSLVLINSCSKDKCKDVNCQNGATCDKDVGVCDCASGYEGTLCETAIRTKFLGNFRGHEQCSLGSDDYDISVVEGSSILVIKINNTYNQGYTAIATVTGTSFTVESQTISSGVTVSGSGSISGDNITYTYTIATSGGPSNSCTFTGARI